MSKFKVGDKVVENCFEYKYNKHWSETSKAIGIIIKISEEGYYHVRFNSFLKYIDDENELDYHKLHEEQLISFDIYNSPLYKVMNEKED